MGSASSGQEEEELKRYRESLEEIVRERVLDLSKLNEELKREVEERKRAEIQLEQRTHELKTMFAVQQAITSRLELDTVLKLIADEARRLTNAQRTGVFLVEGEDLVLSVFSGKDSTKFLGYRIPINKSIAGRILLSRKPSIVNNVKKEDASYPGLIEKTGIKSFLGIPMLSAAKPIGLIIGADKLTGEFTLEDERIVSMLATAAAIGIENARMYQEERRRHQEDEERRHVAESLKDILALLNSKRPLTDVLDFIINQAVHLLGADSGGLYRLQSDKGVLKVEAARGLPEEYISQMTVPVGKGVVGQAVLTRKPMLVSDLPDLAGPDSWNYLNDTSRQPYLKWLAENYRALLAVPLVCQDEIYGGIVLYYRQSHDFRKDEIDLAMTFADQAALAIDNARLREQAEAAAVASERSRLARDLHDAVTQTLFSSSLIAEVLPKIWERNPQEVKRRLAELRQLTRGALAEMRTLLLELRPTTLVESNLKDLLNQLTEAVSGRTKIPVALNIKGQIALPSDVKIAFYRIAQEALNNIAKHSGARQARMELLAPENWISGEFIVQLRICDDGRGFDKSRISPQSLGLGIMRERAEAIGAFLDIKSAIGEGTEVLVRWCSSKEAKRHE